MDTIVGILGGLSDPNKQRDVKAFYSKNKVGIFGLMKPKSNARKFSKVTSPFRGWSHFVNYNMHHKSRVWLMWVVNKFQVDILRPNFQVVHSRVKHLFTAQ